MRARATDVDPYQISTADELRHLGTLVNGGDTTYNATGKWFKLTADLDISGSEWTPIGTANNRFAANFDGNGHTITGLTINQPTMNNVGLFGFADINTTIQNLGVINVSVTGGNNVGGVVGLAVGAVTNCYSTGTVTGNEHVGGVVGGAYKTVSNCYSTGSITGTDFVGGAAGDAQGAVSNCYSTGSVAGNDSVGGVVGFGSATTECYSTADITGQYQVGGVVGSTSTSSVTNCTALNPSITATGNNVGRVVGYTNGVISGCSAFAGMTVNGSTVTDDTATNEDGADATKASFKTANWWKTTAAFPEASWVLANNNLPALKTTGGTLMPGQQTDLPVFLTELPPPLSAAEKLVADLNTMQPGTAQLGPASGNVKLLQNITLTGSITIAGDLTLDT